MPAQSPESAGRYTGADRFRDLLDRCAPRQVGNTVPSSRSFGTPTEVCAWTNFHTPKFALVIYAWAALWGFVTAASRVTAAGQFMPEIWDVVERAPNFMLPAALIYLMYQHRLDHTTSDTTAESVKSARQLTP